MVETIVQQGALSDKDIIALHRDGVDVVQPFFEEFIQPSSIDLRLGFMAYRYNMNDYVVGETIPDECVIRQQLDEDEGLILRPGDTVHVSLYERLNLPENTMGIIFPRSSVTRLGLVIPPVYVNPGYKGKIPLTLFNASGTILRIKPLIRIAQLVLIGLSRHPQKAYADIEDQKYFNEEAKHSQIDKDREIREILDNLLRERYPALYELLKEEE